MRITVIGTGYLGATHAACMAEIGHEVLGVDVDPEKIAKLQNGELPFFEPDLEEMAKRNISAGRLEFTDSYERAAEFADVHFVAVGTPQKRGDFAADLTHVNSAVKSLARLISRPSLIIGKSTVPVGTAELLGEMARGLAPRGIDVEVAWNPEFLREGFAVEDTLRPDRLVLGLDSRNRGCSEVVVRELYAEIIGRGVPFIVTDLATAELVKTAANAFLATKISFINAISEVCDAAGADVTVLADAIGHDVRIGRRFLNAGIGFGGGCLPKDIRAFMARAGELGTSEALTFLREVDAINVRRRTRMVDMVRAQCDGGLIGLRVAVLGAAFKPDSDDVRDSPALNIAGQLQLQGCTVSVYDPKAVENARRIFPTLHYGTSIEEVCKDADVILVLTEWAEFCDLDPDRISNLVAARKVIDGRNCLDRTLWQERGWEIVSPGRSNA